MSSNDSMKQEEKYHIFSTEGVIQWGTFQRGSEGEEEGQVMEEEQEMRRRRGSWSMRGNQ